MSFRIQILEDDRLNIWTNALNDCNDAFPDNSEHLSIQNMNSKQGLYTRHFAIEFNQCNSIRA